MAIKWLALSVFPSDPMMNLPRSVIPVWLRYTTSPPETNSQVHAAMILCSPPGLLYVVPVSPIASYELSGMVAQQLR